MCAFRAGDAMAVKRTIARSQATGAVRKPVLMQPNVDDWVRLKNHLDLLGTQLHDLQWMFKNLIERLRRTRRSRRDARNAKPYR